MQFDILSHKQERDLDLLETWLPIHPEIKVGDEIQASVGCDKRFASCRNTFANQVNFRGFPHMPGNDFVLSYPAIAQTRDGSALVGD